MSSENYELPPSEIIDGSGMRIAIIKARFNNNITDRLTEGALAGLQEHGVRRSDIALFCVPGSFELPLAAQRAAQSKRYSAIICIGAVIRGETAHFDVVAHQTASGIAAVSRAENIPVIFGVLTTDTVEQARERSGVRGKNSGWQAALGAIEMACLLVRLDRAQP